MPCLPSLGAKAPDFTATTTFGPITLSDYKGKWVVLFSHPGDFTPVCTTEFICFANYYPKFKKRNTELIGLSVDSNSSHLAWVYNIYLHTGVEIPFPIIDDRKMEIAKMYGMISEAMSDVSTVRTVFIIDPNQILRTILYYPLTTGRNIPEIIRIIDALQTSDDQKVVTPADWFPGMPVILPYPKTWKELKERINTTNKNYNCMDWYLCFTPDAKKQLSSDKDDYIQPCNPIPTSKIKKVKKVCDRPQINSPISKDVINPKCPNINRIVGEYVLGNPKNLDGKLLDFAIYSFASINPDGTLSIPAPRYLREMVGLKSENPNLKIIVAIGGWGADGFSDAALTPTSRYKFAREVNKLIKQYNLDGIDIDWEYPGTSAAGIKSRPEDKENFTLLLTAIRDVIGDDKWLSVAGTGARDYIKTSAEIDKIAPIINYFNLMAYDFTSGLSGDAGKKHQANLFPSDLSVPGYSIDAQINNLIDAGMPSEKILLGVPFYGRLGNTTKTYDELRANFINKNGYESKFDSVAKASYLVKDGEFAMSFDNILDLYYKGQYVIDNCLGGIFSWTSTYDQSNILANAMNESINSPNELKAELKSYGINIK